MKNEYLAFFFGNEAKVVSFTHLKCVYCDMGGCLHTHFTFFFFLFYSIAVIASSSQGRVNPFKVKILKLV